MQCLYVQTLVHYKPGLGLHKFLGSNLQVLNTCSNIKMISLKIADNSVKLL
jgi:hypothetical protein